MREVQTYMDKLGRTPHRVAAIAGLAVALSLAPSPSSASNLHHATTPPGPCPLTRIAKETMQGFSRRLITCATANWPVPGGAKRAICIARRESGLIPTATSPGGRYLGLFQHAKAYWPSRFKRFVPAAWHLSTSALSGRSNAIVTMRMVRALGGWKASGWPVGSC